MEPAPQGQSRRFIHLALAIGVALLLACSSSGPPENPEGLLTAQPAVEGSSEPEAAPVGQCAADNPFCSAPASWSEGSEPVDYTAQEPIACGAPPVALEPAGVNIMLAVDGAASMEKHWPRISQAMAELRGRLPDADFGVHVFWSDGIPFDFLQGGSAEANEAINTTNNGCKGLEGRILPTGPNDADTLIETLGAGPEGGVIVDIYQVSPLIDALASYLQDDSPLGDPTRTNYLVVFTNGHDNCFGSAFINGDDRRRAYRKLAIELDKRNIRLVPVGLDAPPMDGDPLVFTPPFEGANYQTMLTNYLVLEEMLKFGSSGFEEVPRIDNDQTLTEFATKVAQQFNNCRFQVPLDLDSGAAANPFELTFSINDQVVPRDRRRSEGWDFVNGGTSQVEFFGQSCEALQSNNTVVATKSCSEMVCGTAAVGVETKPRKILVLLDSSQSRTACASADPLLCTFPDPNDPSTSRSYWDVVLQSLGDALIAPVNENVEFGMQFFPSKNSEMFSCEVEAAPEFSPAPTQQLGILRAMLEKTPHGLSPVVAILESVAANPGSLVDPDAISAVVLLSDGGDNCTGAEQGEIVDRLGAAAQGLLDQGIRTFAIRYGPEESAMDGRDEQLEAIVESGGTALDQAPPYIDAKTEQELVDALAAISEEISTCTFALTGLKSTVDKSNTNLFLNGEPVGFDSAGLGEDGWHWVDAEQTEVELLGAACTTFKTNSRTNVFVEFGCEPQLLE